MITQCQLGSEKGLPMAMTARFYLMTFGVVPSEQALTALVSPLTSSRGLKIKCVQCSLNIFSTSSVKFSPKGKRSGAEEIDTRMNRS